MKCAVNGRLNGSLMLLVGTPPMSLAIRRTACPAWGIQVGLGLPCPWRDDMIQPSGVFLGKVVIELSWDCMTSAITVRSDQCFMS